MGNPSDGSFVGKQAPDLKMPDVNGKSISISDFKGKYVLVDVWASWCAPCRAENPNIIEAYNKFKGENFEVLGVSLDKSKGAWLKAIETDKVTWPQISDLKHWGSDAVKAYKIESIPFNVLIDPEGKVIAQNLKGEELQKKLTEVLAKKEKSVSPEQSKPKPDSIKNKSGGGKASINNKELSELGAGLAYEAEDDAGHAAGEQTVSRPTKVR